MLKNNIRKISLALIAGLMMITSIPFSALAEEKNLEENIKLSLVDNEEIYVGDVFELKVENMNSNDKTLIELPEGITMAQENDENVNYNGALVSVLSGSERILKLKAQNQGDYKLKYTNNLGDEEGNFNLKISKQETRDDKSSKKVDEETNGTSFTDEELTEEESHPKATRGFDQSNGNITVEIPALNGEVLQKGISYNVIVTGKFTTPNSTGRRIEFEIPQELKYKSYQVHTPENGKPETQLSSDQAALIDIEMGRPMKQEYYNSYNGRITYNIKPTASTVELIFVISGDDLILYKDILTTFSAKVFENNSQTGSVSVTKTAEPSAGYNANVGSGPIDTVYAIEGEETDLNYHETYVWVGSSPMYLKQIDVTLRYPAGSTINKETSHMGSEFISQDDHVDPEYGEIKYRRKNITEQRPFSNNGTKINTEGLSLGTHKLDSDMYAEYIITFYDGRTKVLKSEKSRPITILEKDNNKLRVNSANGTFKDKDPRYTSSLFKAVFIQLRKQIKQINL